MKIYHPKKLFSPRPQGGGEYFVLGVDKFSCLTILKSIIIIISLYDCEGNFCY